MAHQIHYRVYYEDTDAGGVVYYANYLKFAERARTEMLRDRGLIQSELAEKEDLLFVVRHVSMELLKPARLDDWLRIETSVHSIKGPRISMEQKIYRDETLLVEVKVGVVAISADFKPKRLSEWVEKKLEFRV